MKSYYWLVQDKRVYFIDQSQILFQLVMEERQLFQVDLNAFSMLGKADLKTGMYI